LIDFSANLRIGACILQDSSKRVVLAPQPQQQMFRLDIRIPVLARFISSEKTQRVALFRCSAQTSGFIDRRASATFFVSLLPDSPEFPFTA
jgi:hypothetical protein